MQSLFAHLLFFNSLHHCVYPLSLYTLKQSSYRYINLRTVTVPAFSLPYLPLFLCSYQFSFLKNSVCRDKRFTLLSNKLKFYIKKEKQMSVTTSCFYNSEKRMKLSEEGINNKNSLNDEKVKVKLGTHSGAFHCDEVMGIVLLQYLNKYKNAEIVRSRNDDELKDCDVVIDVGGEFNLQKLRFDHHQRGFEEYFDEKKKTTKLSSAGLVYKYFGKQILKEGFSKLFEDTENQANSGRNSENIIDIIYPLIYDSLIEMIDANDTGVSISDGPLKYKQTTDLPSRISSLNLAWNEDSNEQNNENTRFKEAMKLAKEAFEYQVHFLVNIWYPGRVLVKDAVDKRYTYHPSGKIVVFEKYCFFKEHIFNLENENYINPNEILFCIYPDSSTVRAKSEKNEKRNECITNINNTEIKWRVQALSYQGEHFKSRCPLPEHLRGLNDKELNKAANIDGVEDLIFVHSSGFIGGAESLQSAIKLANLALT